MKNSKIEQMLAQAGYDLYKEDWMRRITNKQKLDRIRDYYDELLDGAFEGDFPEYEEEVGYEQGIYVCFSEFLDNEYQDAEYMKTLFSDKQYQLYLKLE